MRQLQLNILTPILLIAGAALLSAARAEAGGYGIGFQNIPAERYTYVVYTGPQASAITTAPVVTANQEQTTVAYTGTGLVSLASVGSKPTIPYVAKKELLPLTGPRLN